MSEIPYQLIRSRRRTLALTIDCEAKLVVRAPLKLSEVAIRAFISKKSKWIADKQRQAKDYRSQHKAFALEEGENILYLGERHTVLRRDTTKISVEGRLLIVPEVMTIDGFAKWMRSQARVIIGQRVDYYARLMAVEYSSVKVSSAKRRWGSCGASNTLNFAWRLVMCPQAVIDYLVVHELSHITHKNHSAQFWTHVATVMPNYKSARDWLKQNRRLMDVFK